MAWSAWKEFGSAYDFVNDNSWVENGNLTVGKKYIVSANTIHVSTLSITAGATILKSSYTNYGVCALIEATANTLTFNGKINNVIAIPLD